MAQANRPRRSCGITSDNNYKQPGYAMGNSSGPNDHDTDIRIYPNPDCRFAYTINNSQPVRCTWISDQPLFFADYEAAVEDDALMSEDPVFQALERDIMELKGKTTAYEKISKEFVQEEGAVAAQFREDAAFVSEPVSDHPAKVGALSDLLHQSRLASQYLTFARLHNVEIIESRQVADASYDRDARQILIRPDLDQSVQVLLCARELRRMWQHKNGAGLHPLAFHPDHAVVINRAMNADLIINMVRVAWELQLSGYKDAWTRIENSQISDLGRAFAREACVDFRSLNTGKAAIACFETWFLSERCRKCDRHLIQQMLADYQGYVFSDNPETSRSVANDLMVALGKMPFGQNYLSSTVTQILNDPIFTDVRDRSNANFLWFIKFERSFTEAEQESTAENTGVSMMEKIPEPEAQTSATIISFPGRATSAPQRKAAGKGSAPSSVSSDE